jgi:hypothetical protein
VFAGADVHAGAARESECLVDLQPGVRRQHAVARELLVAEVRPVGPDAEIRPERSVDVEVPVETEDRREQICLADLRGIAETCVLEMDLVRSKAGHEEIDTDVRSQHVLRIECDGLFLVEHDVAAERVGQVVLVWIDLMDAESQEPGADNAKTSTAWINNRLRENIGKSLLAGPGVADNTRVCANRIQ